jgi:cAMP-dependent protein kinase regulator
MKEERFNEGETVIKQGDRGDVLYVIESGVLDCYKTFNEEDGQIFLKNYEAGDSFGELALLYNAPRAATIIAKTDCILWSLDRETFNHIIKDSAIRRRNRYENFLKSVDILKSVDTYELTQICDALKVEKVKADEYIIKQGEEGDKFYIIEEGLAYATKRLEDGNYNYNYYFIYLR